MKHATKIMSALVVTLAVGLLSGGAGAAPADKNSAKHNKTIIATLSGPLPPYNFEKEDQTWVGLSSDALAYAADKAGYNVEYRPMAFENEIPALINGRVDVAPGVYVTAERYEKLDYIPLVQTYFGIIMNKGDAAKVKSWADLCGHKIGMHYSAVTERTVKEMNEKYCPKDNFAVSAPVSGSIPDILNNMQHGRVYAALDDVNMWRAAIRQLPDLAIALDKIGPPIYQPLAFKKGSKLREELMPYVLEFLRSDRAEKTSLKYGMGKNVFVSDPDKVMDEILGAKK